MSPEEAALAAAANAFIRQLEESGVFSDLKTVEARLHELTQQLAQLGDATAARARDSDNLAAHVLALEALVAVLLRHVPVNDSDIDAEISRHTTAITGDGEGTRLIRAVARQIIDRAED